MRDRSSRTTPKAGRNQQLIPRRSNSCMPINTGENPDPISRLHPTVDGSRAKAGFSGLITSNDPCLPGHDPTNLRFDVQGRGA